MQKVAELVEECDNIRMFHERWTNRFLWIREVTDQHCLGQLYPLQPDYHGELCSVAELSLSRMEIYK